MRTWHKIVLGLVLAGTAVPFAFFRLQDFIRTHETDIKTKVETALTPRNCPEAPQKTYGSARYTGPLIDTHYHIPHFDSPPPWEKNGVRPLLGDNVVISDIACTLRQEGTKKIFAFFPVFPDYPQEYLAVVKGTMEQYPDLFVPFIMPPDNDNSPTGFPTVDAKQLATMLSVHPSLFQGYGEIGLYERGDHGGPKGALALPPDSQRLAEIYPLIRKNKLVAYFHLGKGQQNSFEKVLSQNPDINFIWHGDQLIPYEDGIQNLQHIEEILSRHPNAFYGVDELYGDKWLIRPEVTKKELLTHLDAYEALLKQDINTWKGFIERHPDQVIWGTDRSPQVRWSHDPDVGQALTGYSRAFIAHLSPAAQEKFAYKNAERLMSE